MCRDRKTILVIDDEPGIVEIIQTNLEAEGYAVLGANSGLVGLKAINEMKPDLVILEVMLPEMDGWDVMRRVGSDPDRAGTPFIVLTVRSEERDLVKGLEMGAIDYVAKPFDPVQLSARVRRVLEEANRNVWEARRRQLILQAKRSMKPLGGLVGSLQL